MDRNSQKDSYYPDISDAVQSINMRSRKNFNLEATLRIYSALGLLLAVGAMIYFLFLAFNITIGPKEQLSLLVAASGLAFSLMSWILLNTRRERDRLEVENLKEYSDMIDLVEYWTMFETISRELLKKEGDEFNQYSPRSILFTLKKEGRITDGDLRVLQEALELRNIVVHGGMRFPPNVVSRVAGQLRGITSKLSEAAPHRSASSAP